MLEDNSWNRRTASRSK